MKNTLAVLTLFALGSLSAFAGQMTGYISDTQCAKDNAKAKTAAEWIHPAVFQACAQKCVKSGSEAIFLTEDNQVLKIDAASMSKVMPHLGHKVTVNGTVHAGKLKVDSISSVKM